jgi:Secretion system C-terminal sorting domain
MNKTLFAAIFMLYSTTTVAAIAPTLSVAYDGQKNGVVIKWQQQFDGIRSFIVQRSTDNSTWADIARQETVNFNPGKIYQFTDDKLTEEKNYYRLKCTSDKGQTEYSATVVIVAADRNFNWVIYPVPVTDMLTLQYKGKGKIEGVINIYIQNIAGQVFTRVRCASLNTIIRIPVSNLGKGVYDIRITVGDEKMWSQRFVK